MRSQTLIFGLAAAGCAFAEPHHDIGEMVDGELPDAIKVIEARADSTSASASASTSTAPDGFHTPKWASTVPPEKISSLKSDMHVLATSIKGNSMYSSMTAVMATAVPQSFKDAVMTNPKSVHHEYKSTKPAWYQALPTDVRSFMEANKNAAKSIFNKDIGPPPSKHREATATAAATSSGKAAQSSAAKSSSAASAKASGSATSEADSLRIIGAATAALLGTLGFAILML